MDTRIQENLCEHAPEGEYGVQKVKNRFLTPTPHFILCPKSRFIRCNKSKFTIQTGVEHSVMIFWRTFIRTGTEV
jgi:hypothetical protein